MVRESDRILVRETRMECSSDQRRNHKSHRQCHYHLALLSFAGRINTKQMEKTSNKTKMNERGHCARGEVETVCLPVRRRPADRRCQCYLDRISTEQSNRQFAMEN